MIGFFIRFLFWLVLLFVLFFIESFSPLYVVQAWQTELTIYLTYLWIHYFDIPVNMIGNTVYLDNGFKIWILDACNGLIAYLLLAVAILAYPTTWVYRLIWLVEGYFYLLLANSLRIDFVIYITMFDAGYFYCAHDCVGMLAMGVIILAFFILFTMRVQTFKYIPHLFKRRNQKSDRRHVSNVHEWREPEMEHRHSSDRRNNQDHRSLNKGDDVKQDIKPDKK